MGVIEVAGIQVFAYHGCLPEEAAIGGPYRVDVAVSGDLTHAERSDLLADTVDYGRVTAIVREQMAIRSAGTCAMGSRRSGGVTDLDGAVHGVRGLYLADPSRMPTSLDRHPSLTLAGLALRTASERVIEDLG